MNFLHLTEGNRLKLCANLTRKDGSSLEENTWFSEDYKILYLPFDSAENLGTGPISGSTINRNQSIKFTTAFQAQMRRGYRLFVFPNPMLSHFANVSGPYIIEQAKHPEMIDVIARFDRKFEIVQLDYLAKIYLGQ